MVVSITRLPLSKLAAILLGILIYLGPISSLSAQTTHSTDSTDNWVQTTTEALNIIRHSLAQSSMLGIDRPQSFKRWYNPGYKKALTMIHTIPTAAGYMYTLEYYVRGFQDYHIGVGTGASSKKIIQHVPFYYGGLLLRYQNNHYLVSYRDENWKNLPPKGAKLLSCDGKSVQKMMDNDVIPYYGLSLEASHYVFADLLFLDANPFRPKPHLCTFLVANQHKHYVIRWKKIDFMQFVMLKRLLHPHYPFRLQTFGQKGLWISIPTLNASGPNALMSTSHFLKLLVKNAPSFRVYDPIVFDVRGNSGGNSEWVEHILSGLFGPSYFKQVIQGQDKSWMEYRVSKQNLKRMETISHISSDMPQGFIQGYRHALKNQQASYSMKPRKKGTLPLQANNKKQQPLFHHPIYFLMDSHCGSSCLLFAEMLSKLPKVIMIGQPTMEDTQYGEVNFFYLPGGLIFQYPMNATRNVIIPKAYQPTYRFDGDITKTKQLMQWVNKLNDDKH